jgi:magnesium transporter
MNIKQTLNPVTTVNVADLLFRKDKRIRLFLRLEPEQRNDALRGLTQHVRRDIVMHIPEPDLVQIIEKASPDEATDLLRLLTRHRRENVLLALNQDIKHSLSTLLEFDPDTAAGLMTLDYIQVSPDDSVEMVSSKFAQHEQRTGRPPVILIVKDGHLKGFLPGHQLGLTKFGDPVGPGIKRMPTISYAATHDAVVRKFQTHPHGKVAVLNDAGDILGIIYSDDVLKLMHQREASSLYDFAGISQEESVSDSVGSKVRNRYRWLIINLGTAFLAASTVGLFEGTLEKYVLLAIYMPIVAGMGGNAATQTLAVQVRGIALRQISLATAWKPLKRELGSGLINGVINGILVAAVVMLINRDPAIAFILGCAMVVNLVVAAFFGTLVPLIMAKLGKDPAASATIFITTATDVLGFMAFLGLATIVLD